ncbi:MAG: hypothetical protein AAB013_02520, partial [Planctomycetota bacterium]
QIRKVRKGYTLKTFVRNTFTLKATGIVCRLAINVRWVRCRPSRRLRTGLTHPTFDRNSRIQEKGKRKILSVL